MAWDTIGSIRGPKGDRGPAGDRGPKGDTGPSSWDAIPDKPETFPPASHTHPDKADLVDGKVPDNQLPALAITEFLGDVADEDEMLSKVGQRGDWVVRTDTGTAWIVIDEPSSEIGSWREFMYPESPVKSVAGRTGSVTLSVGDISGLSTELGKKADSDHIPGLVAQHRPPGITHSGEGPPPSSIPGAKVGDWYLDELTMDYYRIEAI